MEEPLLSMVKPGGHLLSASVDVGLPNNFLFIGDVGRMINFFSCRRRCVVPLFYLLSLWSVFKVTRVCGGILISAITFWTSLAIPPGYNLLSAAMIYLLRL